MASPMLLRPAQWTQASSLCTSTMARIVDFSAAVSSRSHGYTCSSAAWAGDTRSLARSSASVPDVDELSILTARGGGVFHSYSDEVAGRRDSSSAAEIRGNETNAN